MTSPDPTATLRDLFPDARQDAPLKVPRPRRTIVRARSLARPLYWIAGTTTAIAIVMSIGTDDLNVADLLPGRITSALWTVVATILVACTVAYVILRVLHRGLRRTRRAHWKQYAYARGLQPATATMEFRQAPVLKVGHSRRYPALFEGRLASTNAYVGATIWHEDDGDDESVHRAFFVLARLPRGVAPRWCGSSVTRFFHGSLDFDMDLDHGTELRFESWLADVDCSIKVTGAPASDVRWRELFDPILVDALAHGVEAQWLQVGQWLIACASGYDQDDAPVDVMDTLCRSVDVAVAAFQRAAVGDVPRERRDHRVA